MSLDPARTRRAYVVLAILSLIWGYNWIMMKEASFYAGPFEFAALRTVLGSLALFAVLIWRRRSLRLVAPGLTFLLGLLQTAGFTGLSQWALVSGGAGKTAVLAYTMPFWLIVLASLLLHERVRGGQWIAVALAAGGLLLIVEPWSLEATFASEVLAVSSGLSWAAGAVVAKKLRSAVAVDLLSLTAWQMLLGAVVLVVVALLVPGQPIIWSARMSMLVAYVAIVGTGLAWLLWLYVLDNVSAPAAGLGSLAVPVIGVLAASLAFHERPGAFELSGMVLIVAGLATLAWLSAQASRRPRGMSRPPG